LWSDQAPKVDSKPSFFYWIFVQTTTLYYLPSQSRHSEKESPKMEKSSMNTSRNLSMSENILSINVGTLQVHCTTQRACVCMQMIQMDMWMWFTPDPQGLSESDYNRSIQQENNNTHVRLSIPTSDQWMAEGNDLFSFSYWAFCNRYTLTILFGFAEV